MDEISLKLFHEQLEAMLCWAETRQMEVSDISSEDYDPQISAFYRGQSLGLELALNAFRIVYKEDFDNGNK